MTRMEGGNSFNKLLLLPLFQGLSMSELTHIVGHTRLEFRKYHDRDEVITEGQGNMRMYLMTDGTLLQHTEAIDHSYAVEEEVTAPALLQAEHLFGLYHRYTKSYRSKGQSSFIIIDKQEMLKLSKSYMIFHINLLNLISTQCQKALEGPWRKQPLTVKERVIDFMQQHCSHPAGWKCFYIKMETMAQAINETRAKVSVVLRQLRSKGLIIMRRGVIIVPRLELVLQEK